MQFQAANIAPRHHDCKCPHSPPELPILPREEEGNQVKNPNAGRRHFRQFCHCNCTCIHKCHHDSDSCGVELDRVHSPAHVMPASTERRRSGGCILPSDSLVSVVEEMESGRMSLSASFCDIQQDLASNKSTVFKRRRQLSEFAIERDLGEGAYAFVKQGKLRMAPPEAPSIVIKMVIKTKLLPECILHDFDTGLSLPVELYALRHLREHPHPCIVSLIDAFEDPMYYYIMMPMHGKCEDLFEAIEHHQDFLPPDRVARIFSQCVMAIAHLHNVLGLVHRDIKDENIIIDEHDHILLIDFGSCAYYRGGASHVQHDVPLTEADVRSGKKLRSFSAFHGTIDYAPPEVLRGELYDGPQQDIWALGVLLYTLAFKEVPFRSVSDILELRLKLPFEPSPDIARMIKWMLAGNPEERPTASSLEADPWIQENYQAAMRG